MDSKYTCLKRCRGAEFQISLFISSLRVCLSVYKRCNLALGCVILFRPCGNEPRSEDFDQEYTSCVSEITSFFFVFFHIVFSLFLGGISTLSECALQYWTKQILIFILVMGKVMWTTGKSTLRNRYLPPGFGLITATGLFFSSVLACFGYEGFFFFFFLLFHFVFYKWPHETGKVSGTSTLTCIPELYSGDFDGLGWWCVCV